MEKDTINIHAYLGPSGLNPNSSNLEYEKRFRNHLVVFDANIFVLEAKETALWGIIKKKSIEIKKIWRGDFDVTANRAYIQILAQKLGKPLILSEDDRVRSDWKKYLYMVTPSGEESIGDDYKDIVHIDSERIELY